MVARTALLQYLDQLLQSHLFTDYAPNGLQIEGKAEIHTLITGVSANQALLEQALAQQADAVLVHHGFFWKGENPCITGIKQRRIKLLLENDINLFAYHLPLDAHPELGNNATLASALAIHEVNRFDLPGAPGLGFHGTFKSLLSADALAQKLTTILNRAPLHIDGGRGDIQKIMWCTGAAPDLIHKAIELNMDAFITGEIAERTVAIAEEAGIHFFAAGHHATERFGVQALGEHLAKHFNLKHQFIDIVNPV